MAGDNNMVSASKNALPPRSDEGTSVFSMIYRFFKKVSVVGVVYLVGYMQWSVAWLITPIILSVMRDQWSKESEYRRNLAKAAALTSEKDVVLARLDDLPAWVFFPDVERAEWLNRILLQVWPNVNHYARIILKESIEPAVAESLANFKLNGFKFERMILGTIAPRVGGVKVYDKNLSRDEIIMDIDLFYAGDCDISFVVPPIRGGIKDLQIHGMIRIVMKPLITKMPLVGGLQVFFLNNPSIDFNLVGAADVLDMPGFRPDANSTCNSIEKLRKRHARSMSANATQFTPNVSVSDIQNPSTSHFQRCYGPQKKRARSLSTNVNLPSDIECLDSSQQDILLTSISSKELSIHTTDINHTHHQWSNIDIDLLRRCIVEQVAKLMVLPNKLPIKLSDEIPTIDLRMPEPEGVLRIHLVKAENLMKKDVSMIGKGKSDPYAIITVGAQQWKTKTIDNNVNPKWDFWCEAIISSRKGQEVQFEIWDWDPGMGIQNDDFLGRCSLEIAQVVRFGRLDTIQTLQHAKHGKVHLRLSWHRLTTDVTELSRALTETLLIKTGDISSAVLSVYIDSCKRLPNARPQSRPDPYLTVTVGKKTENTAVQMRTGDPVYEIGYSFLVQNPEIDNLEIQALDQKTGNCLGQLVFSISMLLKQKDLTLLTQPLTLLRSGPESKITLSLQLKILKEAVREDEIEEIEANLEPDEPVLVVPSPTTPAESTDGAPPLPSTPAPPAPTPNEPLMIVETTTVSETAPDSASQKSIPLEHIEKEVGLPQESQPPSENETPKLVHRTSSLTTSAGEAGLGRVLLSLRYSMQNQTLYVVVHKIRNIPLKDPTNVPDPYVKLYLLPGRSKDSKRKTVVVKDNCNPEYDEQFEWVIPITELHSRQVEVTVATHKGFLGGSPVIGQVIVQLNQYDFREAKTLWFDLMPETSPRDY